MKMKKLMALVLALTLVLALAACGQTSAPAESGNTTTAPAAEGEQTLIVYTARSESLNNAVIENFEADTGIHVEVVTGGTGYHGSNSKRPHPIGTGVTGDDQLERIRQLAKQRKEN